MAERKDPVYRKLLTLERSRFRGRLFSSSRSYCSFFVRVLSFYHDVFMRLRVHLKMHMQRFTSVGHSGNVSVRRTSRWERV